MSEQPEVWFYLLERSTVEEALPPLVEKCLQRGWRALVRSPDPGRLAALDLKLWTWRDDSWLPHGLAGSPAAERQPILLTGDDHNPNASEAVFVLDGAAPGPLDGVRRVIALFDGRRDEDVTAARQAWRDAKARGQVPSFWKQNGEGRWQQQGV